MDEVVLFESLEQAIKILPDRECREVKINQKKFGVVRLGQRVVVFEAFCPHMDYPMTQGKVNVLGDIICGWHSYRFNLQSGREHESRCRDLLTWEARQDESGKLVVNL